jgi:hypothetical protein
MPFFSSKWRYNPASDFDASLILLQSLSFQSLLLKDHSGASGSDVQQLGHDNVILVV